MFVNFRKGSYRFNLGFDCLSFLYVGSRVVGYGYEDLRYTLCQMGRGVI